jgi:hypothetical protein
MLILNSAAGELEDLIDEFSEGKIQFAFVKVTDPNTGLPKNVLIGWCGEGVPERTKGYFTSHLSAVSKFLSVGVPLCKLDELSFLILGYSRTIMSKSPHAQREI